MQVPGFSEVFETMEETLKVLHRELIDGIDNANRMDEEHSELQRNSIMWAIHVRAYLARSVAIEINESEFSLEAGFNMSLTVHGKSIALRVLKAQAGELPQVGKSPGRRAFFNQVPLQFVLPTFETVETATGEAEIAQNFVLVWSAEAGRLVSLQLACPEPNISEELSEQKWFWVESIYDLTKPASEDVAFNNEGFTDLPNLTIEKRDDEESTGTNG